jgi:hypothetical protein
MKEIKIDDAIRSDKLLLEDVERVTQLLEQEIGPSASEIRAEWSYQGFPDAHSPGDRMVKLTISDQSVHSSVVFSRSGLSLIAHQGSRISLIRLWGDLLQERSHRQVEKLKQLVHTLEED